MESPFDTVRLAVIPALERFRNVLKILDDRNFLGGEHHLPRWRRVFHFWALVFKGFQNNRGPVRAGSLAYTTVLSLVPVLAVVVSISTGFLQHSQGNSIDVLMDYLVTTVAPQLDLVQSGDASDAANSRQAVVQKIKDYINTVNSGTLGITAGILLVFIAVSVLSSVENTFNDIWGVTRGRTWSARIVQYWAAITLAPIFLVTAVALTSTAQIASAAKEDPSTKGAVAEPGPAALVTNVTVLAAPSGVTATAAVVTEKPPNIFRRLVVFLSQAQEDPRLPVRLFAKAVGTIVPFAVLTIFLTLFYGLMPATKVRWEAAAVGGAVGGVLLQLNNVFSVIYLARVVSYSKIYGSLGAVPIFLLGLYFSWLIILLGAQVAYVFQNRQAYLQEKQAESVNQRGREFAALRLMARIGQAFAAGQKPPGRFHLSQALGVPPHLAGQVLNTLTAGKLLIEANGGEETGYVPARPMDKITVEDILSALREGQGSELATADDPARAVLREEYQRVVLAEMHAAGAVTMENLVTRIASLPSAQPAARAGG